MASFSRPLRGLVRKGGRRPGVNFRFAPNWEQVTITAADPGVHENADKAHEAMSRGMARASRRAPGGGVAKEGKGYVAGIGTSGGTHTHWHLIEFGGGRHYGQAVVRRELRRWGTFKEEGPS